MSEEQLHDKIEQYLLLELSPAEATAFEAEVEQDAALKAQVERQRLVLLGLERLATLDLKEKFRAWDVETDAPESPGNVPLPQAFNVWKWISTGLLALLVVAVLFLAKQWPPKEAEPTQMDSRDSLMALTIDFQRVKDQRDSLMSLPRATGDTTLEVRLRVLQEELARKDREIRALQNKAGRPNREYAALFAPAFEEDDSREGQDAVIAEYKKAYNARDFKQAEALSRSIPKNDPRAEQLVPFLPYVFFYQGKYEAAIPALLQLKDFDQFQAQKADWLLLLCYTADMQAHGIKAGVLLKEITGNPGHQYYEDAKKLEARLKADGVL